MGVEGLNSEAVARSVKVFAVGFSLESLGVRGGLSAATESTVCDSEELGAGVG